MAEPVAWIQERVPAWLLLILAGIGTPTSIGNVIWNQNSEVHLQRLRDDVATLKAENAQLWAEMNLRVRTTERVELKADLERRMNALELRMDRIQGYGRGEH